MGRSRNRSARYDPLHRLGGYLRDQFVITVVVQDGDTFSFGHCRDQQVGQADRPHAPAAPHGGLDVKRTPPVLIVGGQPLIASIAVGSYLIELSAAPGCPSEFELDDTAGGYHSRLDQWRQDNSHVRMVQARERAGVCQAACYRCHAARITSSSSRSGKPREVSLCRSRRLAASAVTSRRAALTVSFLVTVPSACWAAARYSSSISMRVLVIAVLLRHQYISEGSIQIYSRSPSGTPEPE